MQRNKGHIRFLPQNREVGIGVETSVLDVALKNKIHIDNSCGGSGSCGTCQIKIHPDSTEPSLRTDVEAEMAKARDFAENERLACQLEPKDGLIIITE